MRRRSSVLGLFLAPRLGMRRFASAFARAARRFSRLRSQAPRVGSRPHSPVPRLDSPLDPRRIRVVRSPGHIIRKLTIYSPREHSFRRRTVHMAGRGGEMSPRWLRAVSGAAIPEKRRLVSQGGRPRRLSGYRQKSVSVYPLFCQFTIDKSSFQVATARLPYRQKKVSDPGLTRLLRLAFSKKKSASGGGKRWRSGNAASAAHP